MNKESTNTLTEIQRRFLYRLLQEFSIIDVHPQNPLQWKMNLEFLVILENNMLELDVYDAIRMAVRSFTMDASGEVRNVITSFVLEYALNEYPVKTPSDLSPDVKNSADIIDWLIAETKSATK